LGYGVVMVVFLCALYWMWDKRHGLCMVQIVLLGALVGHVLKETFQMPRPFEVDLGHVAILDPVMARKLRPATVLWYPPSGASYGFPSGHALGAVCLWGALALHVRRRAMTVAAVALIILIALSRLYLGVHFVGDVAGGLVVGGILLGGYALLIRHDANPRQLPSPQLQIVLLFAAVVILFFLRPDRVAAQRAAALVGFVVGCMLERRWVRFAPSRSAMRRIAALALGLLVFWGVREYFDGAVRVIGAEGLLSYPILRMVCLYGAIGLLSSLGLPFLFTRVRLADLEDRAHRERAL
jgi:glycerophosphoryl diester phosphodiesterase